MARLQTELDLEKDDRLRLVTFTVDPARDQPNDLKEYANSRRAHPDRWLFLTGPEKEIHDLINNGFKVMAQHNTKNPTPGDEFDHSTRIALVDKKGLIRAYFDGMPNENDPQGKQEFEKNLKRLKEKLSQVMGE
jgi:cytochrome oxidase Cu insertion factor (SCO1/SenC/PrrC family)